MNSEKLRQLGHDVDTVEQWQGYADEFISFFGMCCGSEHHRKEWSRCRPQQADPNPDSGEWWWSWDIAPLIKATTQIVRLLHFEAPLLDDRPFLTVLEAAKGFHAIGFNFYLEMRKGSISESLLATPVVDPKTGEVKGPNFAETERARDSAKAAVRELRNMFQERLDSLSTVKSILPPLEILTAKIAKVGEQVEKLPERMALLANSTASSAPLPTPNKEKVRGDAVDRAMQHCTGSERGNARRILRTLAVSGKKEPMKGEDLIPAALKGKIKNSKDGALLATMVKVGLLRKMSKPHRGYGLPKWIKPLKQKAKSPVR